MSVTNVTSKLIDTYPRDHDGATLTLPAGVAWTNSPYARVMPATDVTMHLLYVTIMVPLTNNLETEWDLAFGPAGAETIFCTFGANGYTGGGWNNCHRLMVPHVIAPFKEIYARFRSSGTILYTCAMNLCFIEAAAATTFARGDRNKLKRYHV